MNGRSIPHHDDVPAVGIIVVHYGSPDLTLACLTSVTSVAWPANRLKIVLVDNSLNDHLVAAVRRHWPAIEVIEPGKNHGFAGGCNLGFHRLEDVDLIALLNNDATVTRDWLNALVKALQSEPNLGAATSKVLFADRFADVLLRSPTHRRRGDRRRLGVRLSGVEIDGTDGWQRSQFVRGFFGLEQGRGAERSYQWTAGEALLRVPCLGSRPRAVRLRLACNEEVPVDVRAGDSPIRLLVGPEPVWHELQLNGRCVDLVNNTGLNLLRDGYGSDRGYQQPDGVDYDQPAEVFAWSGTAVLLRRSYLDDVGLFDERFFAYYEDLDLSWRGRLRGWRYLFVPQAVVRHAHAASTVEGSPFFEHHNQRNRLLTVTRNAPACFVLATYTRFISVTASYAWRDLAVPALGGTGTVDRHVPWRRLAALVDALRFLPSVLADRRRAQRFVSRRAAIERWVTSTPT